jgi:hypothetical protein
VLAASDTREALNNRGGGMIYDDMLNITRLQDANCAKNSYDDDGRMGWKPARIWAYSLTFGGFVNWRLCHEPLFKRALTKHFDGRDDPRIIELLPRS